MADKLKSFCRAVVAVAPVLARDAVGISGAAMIAYGASMIYPPAGWIVGGVMLLVSAWLSAKARP